MKKVWNLMQILFSGLGGFMGYFYGDVMDLYFRSLYLYQLIM